jgi:hypothetical protein
MMPTTAPPPGGRVLFCPCGSGWAGVWGSRQAQDHAACIVARFGIDRIPCIACGGFVAPLPASAESRPRGTP